MKREQIREKHPGLSEGQAVLLASVHFARLALRTARDEATRQDQRRSLEAGLRLADGQGIPWKVQNWVLHHAETVSL